MVTKRKHRKRGRPRDISSPIVDRNNPDNYPTLIRYLEAQGKIQHINYVHMMKARNLYMQGMSSQRISENMGNKIEPSIIDRWALMFEWDEDRDKRLFEKFRKVAGADRPYGGDLAERHERIAGGIEQYAERMLQSAANGEKEITSRDLSTLASTIKSTQEIRRTARGVNIEKKENSLNVNVNMPSSMERIAGALMDVYDKPKKITVESRTIAVGTEDQIGSDTEYEASNGQPT